MNKYFQFLTAVLIAFGFISCSTGNENNETPSAPEFPAEPVLDNCTPLTDLQILMAEKALKDKNENNPVAIHKFTADPCVLVYNDTIFVYGTNDHQQSEGCWKTDEPINDYSLVNSINIFSSKDLVNWTDCGEIPVAGEKGLAKWASNSWAPAIACKKIDGKDKFFLYFADNGSGIGVLTADSPTGPFTDPIGKQLISRSTPNTEGVYWLFDPAVLIDEDGTGYLYYGGGTNDVELQHPESGRCVQLGEDMISIVGTPVKIDAPWLFEDSGINKINGKYVYSYCTNWADRAGATGDVPPAAVIAYMTSDNPLGPFTYTGWFLKNPGEYFGEWGNNHHWIFELNNKMYVAYHAQEVAKRKAGIEKNVIRTLYINELEMYEDGSIPVQNMTRAGCEKIADFNPYGTIPAATFHSFKDVAVSNKQTVIPVKANGWMLIKNTDFSRGAAKLSLNVSEKSNGSVKFVFDSPDSDVIIAHIDLSKEKTKNIDFKDSLQGIHDLYIIFNGTVELESWTLE